MDASRPGGEVRMQNLRCGLAYRFQRRTHFVSAFLSNIMILLEKMRVFTWQKRSSSMQRTIPRAICNGHIEPQVLKSTSSPIQSKSFQCV